MLSSRFRSSPPPPPPPPPVLIHRFVPFLLCSTQSGTFVVGDFFKINQNGFAFTDSVATPAPNGLVTTTTGSSGDSTLAAMDTGSALTLPLPVPVNGVSGGGSSNGSGSLLSPNLQTINTNSPPGGTATTAGTPSSSAAGLTPGAAVATPASTTSTGSTGSGSGSGGSGSGVSAYRGGTQRRLVVNSLHDIEALHAVGQGASGVVRRARHKPTGTIVALKVVPIDLSATKSQQVVTELKTLYQCHSPYIISFMGAFYKDRAISLVMEYMESGSLSDVLKVSADLPSAVSGAAAAESMGGLSEPLIAEIFTHVLRGLVYLHTDRRILHRDIKPSNILMNSFGQVKLADFGVSGELTAQSASKVSFVGTVTYMSPERIQGQSHSFESDIWSVGLCLVECALGYFPYLDQLGTIPEQPDTTHHHTTHTTHTTHTQTAAAAAPIVTVPVVQTPVPASTDTTPTTASAASASGASVGLTLPIPVTPVSLPIPGLTLATPTAELAANSLHSPAVSLLSPPASAGGGGSSSAMQIGPSPMAAAGSGVSGGSTVPSPMAVTPGAAAITAATTTIASERTPPPPQLSATGLPILPPTTTTTAAAAKTTSQTLTLRTGAAAGAESTAPVATPGPAAPNTTRNSIRARRISSTKVGFWDIMEKIVSQPPPQLPEISPTTGQPFSPEFRSFTTACLQKDSSKRASAVQLLNHPFLAKYEKSNELPAFMHGIAQAIEARKRAFLATGGAAGALGTGSSASSNPFLAAATSAARAGYAALESPVGTAIRWAAAPEEIAPLPPSTGAGGVDHTQQYATSDWGMGGPGRPHFYAATPTPSSASGALDSTRSTSHTPDGASTPATALAAPTVEEDIPILPGSEIETTNEYTDSSVEGANQIPTTSESSGSTGAAAEIPSDALAQLLSSLDDPPSLPQGSPPPPAPLGRVWSSPGKPLVTAPVASAFLQFAEQSHGLTTSLGGSAAVSTPNDSMSDVSPSVAASSAGTDAIASANGGGERAVVKRKRSSTPMHKPGIPAHLHLTYPLSLELDEPPQSTGATAAAAPVTASGGAPIASAAGGAAPPLTGILRTGSLITRAASDDVGGATANASGAQRPVKRLRRQSQFSFQLNPKLLSQTPPPPRPHQLLIPPPPPAPPPGPNGVPLPALVRPRSLPTPPASAEQ